ncbi:MAG: hypothetical protein DIU74_012075 [Pseudomonadota bacterium]
MDRRCLLIGIFLALPGAGAVCAEEKTQEATGQVAPHSSAEEKRAASRARKDDAQWIERCDRLQGEARFRCLEEMREEMVRRLESGEAPAASTAAEQRKAD